MRDPLKILFISNGFPPTRWAGVETYTAALAHEFIEREYRIQVLCCGEWHKGKKHWNGYVDDFYNDLPVRRINLNWQLSPDPQKYLYSNPMVAKFLDMYLKEIKPDLVHITSCETLSASVLPVIKENLLPLILSITDFWFLCPTINLLRSDGENCNGNTTAWECLKCTSRNSKLYQWANHIFPEKGLEVFLTPISKIPLVSRQRGLRGFFADMADRKQFMRNAFSLPDVRLAASKFVRDIHLNNGFDDPIRLHPYGHDVSWLKNYDGKQESQTLNIGFIGRISITKGVHLLLEAARLLGDVHNNKVKFLIYGDLNQHPEYAGRLKELADGLNNVEFCGIYPHKLSADVFSRIDVLAVPSLWYDFPLIIHEAFATGTPVIATNLGAMAEMVSNGENGLLFDRGSANDLVKKIQLLLDEPELLERLQQGVPQVRTIQDEVNALESMYVETISENNTSVVGSAAE